MDETFIKNLMSEPVLTVDRTDVAVDVAGAMRESGVNSVVVTGENCHPTGILTATDYVEMTADAVNPHEATVERFMTTDIVTARPDDHVSVAAETIAGREFSHLPIVDETEQVVGIITQTDLVAYLADGQ
jgi:CBS domain-containing protein